MNSIEAFAVAIGGFVRAWRELLEAELALAARSMRAMLIGALLLPFLLLGCWLSVIAAAILLLQFLGLSWLTATAVGCLIQFGALLLLFRAMRRWAGTLPLPRSRAVLTRLLGSIA